MMNKDQKKNYIIKMKDSFLKNESVLIAHYQGLTVKQIESLRSDMRKKDIILKITKNRITKLAIKGTKCESLSDLFTGPTAVIFADDAITSAKILTKFSKENSSLKIRGGMMGNDTLKVEDVMRIATLPTLEEARAKIVDILSISAKKILSILLAPGSKIAILAHAKSIK